MRRIRDVPGLDAEIAVGKVWRRVEEKVEELENEIIKQLFKEKQKEGFFNEICEISDVLEIGTHAGQTFMGLYFCVPGYCSWALSQHSRRWTRRAGDIEHKDKREKEKREKERDWITAKLRKEIQDRTSKCAEELARDGESHLDEGGEEKKKTDWMELLEVARVQDTGATEESKEGRGQRREWEVMEGKGKVRSDVWERKGRGPSGRCLTWVRVAHTPRPFGMLLKWRKEKERGKEAEAVQRKGRGIIKRSNSRTGGQLEEEERWRKQTVGTRVQEVDDWALWGSSARLAGEMERRQEKERDLAAVTLARQHTCSVKRMNEFEGLMVGARAAQMDAMLLARQSSEERKKEKGMRTRD